LSGQQDLPAPSSLPGLSLEKLMQVTGIVTSGSGTGGTILGAKFEETEKKV
jgi:hypothetical protein